MVAAVQLTHGIGLRCKPQHVAYHLIGHLTLEFNVVNRHHRTYGAHVGNFVVKLVQKYGYKRRLPVVAVDEVNVQLRYIVNGFAHRF